LREIKEWIWIPVARGEKVNILVDKAAK